MTFTASNGMTVEREHDSDVLINRGTGTASVFFANGTALALREFFQHERDEELGRWRWPDNRDYVVYPTDGFPDEVTVLSEAVGESDQYLRDGTYEGWGWKCARAYFDAHPERKPWDLSELGDYWALTDESGIERLYKKTPDGWKHEGKKRRSASPEGSFVEGRRIWPES